ncbi:ORF6C domain-containing protein [Lysinibacillus sp. HST-98]|uniref:ORF6C domain-containing protein n=1 Tax=Lysinibacillus sp. HST-98 TaxID=2800419 RepID=UPI001F240CBD|nr:ORF6C domain-containing protein [Lysinibacillus sp. HST-98]
MNQLITTTTNEQGEIIVSGRELHEFLEVKTPYTQWFERMIEYGFVENIDFIGLSQKSEKPQGGRPTQDHALKIDMAKEISMIQRNEKGKQARQYFIEVEKHYKQQLPQYNSLELALKAALEHEQAIKEIKTDVDYLKETIRIDGLQQQEIQQAAKQSIVHALGGKDSIAYQEISKKVFSAFWNEFKQYFKVPRYGDIPKVKYEEALRFISLWRPSTSLQIEIDSCNSQMAFG